MLLEKYQKLLTKDIEDIISYIFDNYNVCTLDSTQKVNKEEIIQHFLSSQKENIKKCRGVLNSGLQCNRSSMKNEIYCKTHYLKYQKTNYITKEQLLEPIIFENELHKNECSLNECSLNDKNILENTHLLKKIFIDNSLYLHDDQFLYDPVSKEKVGYKNDLNKFILTNDPFILCSF